MRVYFGVCGVGLGHVSRCVSIARQLQTEGSEVLFSIYNDDAIKYLEYEKISFVEAPPIYYDVKQDGEIDFRQTTVYPGAFSSIIFLRQVGNEIKYMRSFKPNVVVSDSRASTVAAATLLHLPIITILNLYRVRIPRQQRFLKLAQIADGGILTVIGRLWSLSREILIPDFREPYTLSEGNLGIPPWRKGQIRLVGPIIPVKPENLANKNELRRKLGLKDGPLIFVPISGPSQEKEYFIGRMQDILLKLPTDYQVIVSLANPRDYHEPTRKANVTVYDWIPNRFEFLKACDIVLCRAGLGTISEAVCYGKPLLTIPTPSHTEQQNNAYRAQKLGVAKVLDQKRLSTEYILSGIEELLGDKYVARALKLQREVGEYQANESITESIKYHGEIN